MQHYKLTADGIYGGCVWTNLILRSAVLFIVLSRFFLIEMKRHNLATNACQPHILCVCSRLYND